MLVVGVFFTLFFLPQVKAGTVLDTIVITEKFENVLLKEAFQTIAQNYHLDFAYDEAAIENIRVTKELNGLPLKTALFQLLEKTNITFMIVGQRQVLFRQKKKTTSDTLSQKILSGRIIDYRSRQPLASVTVYLSDFSRGTYTNEDGYFELSLGQVADSTQLNIQYSVSW